jgi:uncharacterized protein YfbU (UPF0304 family)
MENVLEYSGITVHDIRFMKKFIDKYWFQYAQSNHKVTEMIPLLECYTKLDEIIQACENEIGNPATSMTC